MSYDETKLPKWAQVELNRLRSKAAIEENETKIEMNPHPLQSVRTYLPDGSTIRFATTGGYLDVVAEGDALRISGTSGLAISPVAANMISVAIEPREPISTPAPRSRLGVDHV